MTISDASKQGIERLRLAEWASPTCYLKIDLVADGHGPWGHLWDRVTQRIIRAPTPQDFLIIGDKSDNYIQYDGPVDEAEAEKEGK